jgi:hypothetical protein
VCLVPPRPCRASECWCQVRAAARPYYRLCRLEELGARAGTTYVDSSADLLQLLAALQTPLQTEVQFAEAHGALVSTYSIVDSAAAAGCSACATAGSCCLRPGSDDSGLCHQWVLRVAGVHSRVSRAGFAGRRAVCVVVPHRAALKNRRTPASSSDHCEAADSGQHTPPAWSV